MNCHHCGTEFTARRSTARFCSSKCRVYAYRHGNDEENEQRAERNYSNMERMEAQTYIDKFYMPAQAIIHFNRNPSASRALFNLPHTNPKTIAAIVRKHRYMFKIPVTPDELRQAGHFLLQLARAEER